MDSCWYLRQVNVTPDLLERRQLFLEISIRFPNSTIDSNLQGLKKVPSSCLGPAGFPTRQVTFYSHLPIEQGPGQVVFQLSKTKTFPGEAKFECCLSKGQARAQVSLTMIIPATFSANVVLQL